MDDKHTEITIEDEDISHPQYEIVYSSEDNTKEKYCINYDVNNIINIIGLVIFSGIAFGISYQTKKDNISYEIENLELWVWFRIISFIPLVYICGVITDTVVFAFIDLFNYFESYTTIVIYYLSSFRNIFGHIIVVVAFHSYYETIMEIETSSTINNIFKIIVVGLILLAFRNLLVNIVMRKQLIKIFKDNVNLILRFKQIIHDISYLKAYDDGYDMSRYDKYEMNRKNVSFWKLLKVKNSGFEYWENNKKINIYTKKKMMSISGTMWNYLLKKYAETEEFKSQYENAIVADPFKIDRIPIKFLMAQVELTKTMPNYKAIEEIFDPQRDTFIAENDFRTGIIEMFQKWKESNTFLVGYNNLSTVLKYVMSFITYFIILIISLNIFNIPLSSVFVPLATVTVTISFSIGGVLSKIASNVVFIVFTEPYKIGQRVFIQNVSESNLIVKNISILKTIFQETRSGKLVIVPNHELFNMNIINHNESQKVIFNLIFKVGSETATDKIAELTQELNNYLKTFPNEWKPKCDLFLDTVEYDKNSVSLIYWVQHFSSWGDGAVYDSRTKLMLHMINVIDKLGIRYKQPTIPVEYLKKNE